MTRLACAAAAAAALFVAASHAKAAGPGDFPDLGMRAGECRSTARRIRAAGRDVASAVRAVLDAERADGDYTRWQGLAGMPDARRYATELAAFGRHCRDAAPETDAYSRVAARLDALQGEAFAAGSKARYGTPSGREASRREELASLDDADRESAALPDPSYEPPTEADDHE